MAAHGFLGRKSRRSYFEGWYFKQQTKNHSVALIPAFHVDEAGRASASIQVITNEASHHFDFPARDFHANSRDLTIRVGDSFFSRHGCRLHMKQKGLSLEGILHFGDFTQPAYDIMGPFRFVPFMECRHSVFSLYHTVNGRLHINGTEIHFRRGTGYMEGDRGVSFPKRYVWTQCSWGQNCIMLSVADIPFAGGSFTGCIGSIYFNGKEHRLATYLGVKLLHVSDDTVLLRQGEWMLKIRLINSSPFLLRAPRQGSMSRFIHESVSCEVRYTCKVGGMTLFDFMSHSASFESNWNKPAVPK